MDKNETYVQIILHEQVIYKVRTYKAYICQRFRTTPCVTKGLPDIIYVGVCAQTVQYCD